MRYLKPEELTEDLVLEAAVELLMAGCIDITPGDVARHLNGLKHHDSISWSLESRTKGLLAALAEQGYLKDRGATIVPIFDWVSFAELGRARLRLGLPAGPPTVRLLGPEDLEREHRLSGTAKELLRVLLDAYDEGSFWPTDDELKERFPYSAAVYHEACLELIGESSLMESSFRPGGPYHWLSDVAAARLVSERDEVRPPARSRPSALAGA